jgi:hypothetical protein
MAGDGEAAEAYLHRALELGEELGMSAELGRAHFNLARFYDLTSAGHSAGSTGSVDEIESHCRAAERIFEACGMVSCLDAVVGMRLGRS